MALYCSHKTIDIIKRKKSSLLNIMVIFIVSIAFMFPPQQKKKLELHKKVCENKDLCNVNMVFDNTKILEFHQYQKSDKAPFIIYADPVPSA